MKDKENKLIAEFMGYEVIDKPKVVNGENFFEYIDENGKYTYCNSLLRYNDQWDWLMPVLKKIKLQIHPNNMGMWRKVTQPIGYDIHEVHQEAVEFIKRYSNE